MKPAPGTVCWVDLAAHDAAGSLDFYGRLFGWTARDESLHGGTYTRLSHEGRELGSLYRISAREAGLGMPQHWTPYVAVEDAAAAQRRAIELGATLIAPAFDVPGLARVAVVADPGGAPIGLWQDTRE